MENLEGSASRFLLDGLSRLLPERLVSRGIQELVARPGHALGPPLPGHDLVRLDEACVVKETDVIVDLLNLVPALDEVAESGRARVIDAPLEVQEQASNQIEVSLHAFNPFPPPDREFRLRRWCRAPSPAESAPEER